MKKLNTFLYVLKNSLTNPKYYQDVVNTNVSFSIKYFLTLSLLATLTVTIRVGLTTVPEIQRGIISFTSEIVDIFPDELVFEAKDNEWSINKEEPFVLALPELSTPEEDQEDIEFPSNMVVFDHQGTINDLDKYDTLALLNGSNLIIRGEGNKLEVHPFTDLPDTKITKETINNLHAKIEKYLSFLPLFFYSLIFLFTGLYFFLLRLVYFLSVTAVYIIIGKTKKLNLSFGSYYKIAIHTFTLPLLFELAAILIGVTIPIPLWIFIINVIFGIFVLGQFSRPSETT